MNIVIPSYKRSHDLRGADYFGTAMYCVPESQADEYSNVIDRARLVVIPDSEDGNIVKKRNWILKNLPRPLLMLDDDIDCLMMCEGRETASKGYTRPKGMIKLTSEQAYNVIYSGFDLADQLGCPLWGINVNKDPLNYMPNAPIRFNMVILWPFQGHLDHDLVFDDRMGNKEDYDMALQVLQKYGKILRFNKYSYNCGHFDNKGGIVSYRTTEKEMQYAKAIMKKWGSKVIKYDLNPKRQSDFLNGTVRVPIRGI